MGTFNKVVIDLFLMHCIRPQFYTGGWMCELASPIMQNELPTTYLLVNHITQMTKSSEMDGIIP